jgi:GAF domain-containing protein
MAPPGETPDLLGNVYHNAVTSVAKTAVVDPADRAEVVFEESVDQALHCGAELARHALRSHQAAIAMITGGDWKTARKYFSLSKKYERWADYRSPAVGFGIHGAVVKENRPYRLSQADLERHPEWRAFGTEAAKHPPMQGWLALPLTTADGRNYGLIQVSDKEEGDYTEQDEQLLSLLASLVSETIDALTEIRDRDRRQLAPVG